MKKTAHLLLVILAFLVSPGSSMYGNMIYAEDAIDYMEGQAEAVFGVLYRR